MPSDAKQASRRRRTAEPSSVAVAAAKALRREILTRSDDQMFLGSEDDLVRWLGISRPTFRQAARLLEYEELLVIRRGVGGGFFGRKPSVEAVARMAELYLVAQDASYPDIVQVQAVLEGEILRRIVARPDPEARGRLAAYVRDDPRLRAPHDLKEAVRAIDGYWRLAAELAGSPALSLFLRASQSYGYRASRLRLTAPRLEFYAGWLAKLSAALQAGDLDASLALTRERFAVVRGWFDEPPTPDPIGDAPAA